jgi:ribosomal protein L5
LTETYTAEVVPALLKQFGYTSSHGRAAVTKVVVNMGIGDAIQDGKAMDAAVEELRGSPGQKADDHPAPEVRSRTSSCARDGRSAAACTLRGQADVRVPRAAD